MKEVNATLRRPADLEELYANHMHAAECAKRYGKPKQEGAGLVEVINVIGRKGLHGMDSTKMSHEEMSRVLPSFMFYKAKDPLPGDKEDDVPDLAESECDPDEQPWVEVINKRASRKQNKASKTLHGRKSQRDAKRDERAKIRARLVGGGNHQHRGPELADQVAPTARSCTHNILLAIAALEKRSVEVGDVPSAYLQTKHETSDGLPIFIKTDRETTRLIVMAYPDMASLVRPDGTMILRVDLALYGLVESAWLWYKELVRFLEGLGYTIAEADKGLAYKFLYEGDKCIGSNFASLHVDDILCTPSNDLNGRKLSDEFWGAMESKWPGIKRQNGPAYKHLSWDIVRDAKTGVISKSQGAYFADIMSDLNIKGVQKSPCRGDLLSARSESSPLLSPAREKDYRSILQRVGFGRDGRADIDVVVSRLQRYQNRPTEDDWKDLQHLLEYINYATDTPIIYAPTDSQVRMECDAGFNVTDMGDSQGGWIMTVGGSTVASKSFRIKTIVRDSTSAEIVAVTEGLSEALWARDLLIELGYPQRSIPFQEDNKSCITMLQNEPRNFQTKSKHVRVKWRFYRQVHRNGLVHLVYCPTADMRADLLTKPLGGNARIRHMTSILAGTGAVKQGSEGRKR